MIGKQPFLPELAGSNNEDRTIDFFIDDYRYRYFVNGSPEELLQKYRTLLPRSRRRAFNWIRKQAIRYERTPLR